MDSKEVKYKVVLYRKLDTSSGGGKEQVEIRRFSLSQDVASSYDHLSKKLTSIFPVLSKRSMTVTWVDCDGDEITISSDEELALALPEMPGPVCRLSVCYRDKDAVDGAGDGNVAGQLHPNVICDGCECQIVGFRYKCVQCVDFDLCGRCEAMGLHACHNMMRIATPDRVWPKHFFHRLGKMHERIGRKEAAAAAAASGEVPPPFGPRGHCRWQRFGQGPAVFPPGRGWEGFVADAAGGVRDMMTQHAEAFNAAAKQHAEVAAKKHAEAVKAAAKRHAEAVNEAKKPDEAANAASTGNPEVGKKEAEGQLPSPTAFLANVGQAVAAALDPLGIDVHVGVEHGGRVTEVSASAPKDKKEASPTAPSSEDDDEKEEFEWTVLNSSPPREEAEKEIEVPVKVAGSDAEKDGEALYPELPKEEANAKGVKDKKEGDEPSAPPEAADAQHKDPKIRVALQAMMNMGFRDDGGWLTQLLESKKGDIGKVLDVLQPVAPVRK